MYCGHIGIGLGAKGMRPAIPLAVLLAAAFGPDWLETCLIAADVKNTAIWSHSLPSVALLATLVYAVSLRLRRSQADAAVITGLYISHLLVDYLTSRKPLGLRPNGPLFGLGLYHHSLIDFVMESAVILIGWTLYRRSLATSQARKHPFAYTMLFALLALQGFFDWKFTGP